MARKFKKVLSTAIGMKRAASMLAAGATEAEVARELGCTPGAVNQFKRRNRLLLEAEQQRFLSCVPNAVGTAVELIKDYNDPKKRESMSSQLQGHAHAHTIEVLRMSGIYPSSKKMPTMIQKLRVDVSNELINVEPVGKEDIYKKVMDLIKKV
jgi:predicted transcriptional regulator